MPETLYAVWASDHADALALRERVRPQHRRRLRDAHPGVQVLAAGPTLGVPPDAPTMNGTLLIVRADSAEAVRAFLQADPYQEHGVYRQVEVRPWMCGLGPWSPDEETPT